MKDDAVAPVVAAMLILAVIVTVFSVWNAVYLPSLKQQSEMMQDDEIEAAFTTFSADLANAVSLKRDLTFFSTLPLGGGGVIFSPTTSSGTLHIQEEPKQMYTVTITDSAGDHQIAGRLVNFSYSPVNDFWLDQGYSWHYGYVNVTRGDSPDGADRAALSTPLQYATMHDVRNSTTIRAFAKSIITFESRPWYNSSLNCSHITVSPVTFHREPQASYVSSNGIGTLALIAEVNETRYGVTETTSPDRLAIRVSRSVPEPFSSGLYEECNESFADLAATYPHNIMHTFTTTALYNETAIQPVPGGLPFDVTLHHVTMNVSAR